MVCNSQWCHLKSVYQSHTHTRSSSTNNTSKPTSVLADARLAAVSCARWCWCCPTSLNLAFIYCCRIVVRLSVCGCVCKATTTTTKKPYSWFTSFFFPAPIRNHPPPRRPPSQHTNLVSRRCGAVYYTFVYVYRIQQRDGVVDLCKI